MAARDRAWQLLVLLLAAAAAALPDPAAGAPARAEAAAAAGGGPAAFPQRLGRPAHADSLHVQDSTAARTGSGSRGPPRGQAAPAPQQPPQQVPRERELRSGGMPHWLRLPGTSPAAAPRRDAAAALGSAAPGRSRPSLQAEGIPRPWQRRRLASWARLLVKSPNATEPTIRE
jgi:hypothetical protein